MADGVVGPAKSKCTGIDATRKLAILSITNRMAESPPRHSWRAGCGGANPAAQ